MGRIMPEVSLKTSEWVLKDLAKRGANVHLDTQVTGAVDGNVELSTGEVIPTDLIIWTAGVMANPTVVRGSDLPVEERGRIRTRADLRVGTADEVVEGAGRPVTCPPSRPHGQGRRRLLRAQRAARRPSGEAAREEPRRRPARRGAPRVHPPQPRRRRRPRLYNGVFQSGNIALKGFIAWCAHRGYHGLAMPSWERKWRVIGDWWHNFWLTRDNVSLQTVQNPRYVFEEFARVRVRRRPSRLRRRRRHRRSTRSRSPTEKAAVKKAPAKKAPAKASTEVDSTNPHPARGWGFVVRAG
jgi:NADH dehydrogenase